MRNLLTDLRKVVNESENAEDGLIQRILNVMDTSDKKRPIRKCKDDALTIDRIIELQRHVKLGNNIISTNDVNLIKDAIAKSENRKKIDGYIATLNSRVISCREVIQSKLDEINEIKNQMEIFNDIFDHISERGHLTNLISILDSKDVDNSKDLQWVVKGGILKNKILLKNNEKIKTIELSILEHNEEVSLINEEIELIKAYDKDTNYINFDKIIKYIYS